MEGHEGGAPQSYAFFKNPLPPPKLMPPHGVPPHLKMKRPPPLTPLKHETPFHEMIPTKSTINNNLGSS